MIGAPMWITEGGRAVLVGIVVRGPECLKQNSTGIYTRYSKGPPMPARTIRRRSYKTFDEEAFVADLEALD